MKCAKETWFQLQFAILPNPIHGLQLLYTADMKRPHRIFISLGLVVGVLLTVLELQAAIVDYTSNEHRRVEISYQHNTEMNLSQGFLCVGVAYKHLDLVFDSILRSTGAPGERNGTELGPG